MYWRNTEKRKDQVHYKKARFFHPTKFFLEKMSSSLYMLLVMLLIHEENRSNSRLQMFFETGFLGVRFNKVSGLKT